MAPLHRAVALKEVHDVAVAVAQNLHLNVAGSGAGGSIAGAVDDTGEISRVSAGVWPVWPDRRTAQ